MENATPKTDRRERWEAQKARQMERKAARRNKRARADFFGGLAA